LSKYFRLLSYELDITIPALDPMKCIAKIANKASINEMTKRKAMTIMNQITEKEISAGKILLDWPRLSSIYCLKTGENKTQSDIAKAAGITGVTLRN